MEAGGRGGDRDERSQESGHSSASNRVAASQPPAHGAHSATNRSTQSLIYFVQARVLGCAPSAVDASGSDLKPLALRREERFP